MVIKNDFTGVYEMHYQPLDYYKAMNECITERNRLAKKPDKGVTYVCVRVDRE